jgi:bacteriocin-like protein
MTTEQSGSPDEAAFFACEKIPKQTPGIDAGTETACDNVTCVTSERALRLYYCNLKEEDHTMDNRKADLGKQHKPAEGSRDNLKAELSEEELSKVSGGRLGSACATGEHIKKAVLTC